MKHADSSAEKLAKPLRVVVVEDSAGNASLLVGALADAGCALTLKRVQNAEAMRAALADHTWDIVCLAHTMPGSDARNIFKVLQESGGDIPFIIVSATIAAQVAVELLSAGARAVAGKDNLAELPPMGGRERRGVNSSRGRRWEDEELARQRAFLRQVIDLDHCLIFAQDREGRFTLANQATAHACGTTVDELVGKTDADFNSDTAEVERLRKLDIEVMDSQREMLIPELQFTDTAGNVRWLQMTKSPIVAGDGVATMVLTVASDITHRKKQEDRITRLSRIYAVRSTFNAGIARVRDRADLFRAVCRIAVEQGGLRTAWIGLAAPGTSKVKPVAWAGVDEGYLNEVGLRLKDTIEDHGCGGRAITENKPVVVNDVEADARVVFKQEALDRGYRALAIFPLQVQGETAGILALHAAQKGFFDNEEISLLTELAADISFALGHLARTEEVNYLAYYDVLTGLANRNMFYDRLSRVVNLAGHEKQQARTAVIVIDINRFRFINSTLGRQGGDSVLKTVADRLREAIEVRARLGRVGGDTFAVVVPRVRNEADVAEFLTAKIIPSLSRPLQVNGKEIRLLVKAGIVLSPQDGNDAETLLRNAEAALGKAKSGGEQVMFYAPHMNQRVASQFDLEAKLHIALEKEQFVLHYQPKVDLSTGRICGLEALLRWKDPEAGLVPPLEFIPLLEETGLILTVGRWAMKKAVSDALAWQAGGLDVPRIAVNVSPIQLGQEDFVSSVENVLSAAADSGHKLEFEITESVIMDNVEANIQKLHSIRQMGIEVSIDDFGTGYSSLSYIAKLPINKLKIDRAFIVNMTSNAEDAGIVSTIISLAHILKLRVVAEGVETMEQAVLLKSLKCDEIQGYLFSPPVPDDQIPQFLREDRSLSV